MFTATFGGNTYDDVGIDLLELQHARGALKLWKERGRPAPEIFSESELDATDALLKKWITDANGDLKPTDITITATGMSAEEFIEKFHEITKDKQLMLAAEPEHYLMSVENGKIRGIEICGGEPLELTMTLSEEFLSVVAPDPDYPTHLVAKGFTRAGDFITAGMHQFRTTSEGFEAKLALYFGGAIPDHNVHHHREHLAVEHRNWYQFALEKLGRTG